MSGRSNPWQAAKRPTKRNGQSKEWEHKRWKTICVCLRVRIVGFPGAFLSKSKPSGHLSPPIHLHVFSLKEKKQKTKNTVCLPALPGVFSFTQQIWSNLIHIQDCQWILPGKSPTTYYLVPARKQIKTRQFTSIYNHGSFTAKRTLHKTVGESTYFCQSQPVWMILNAASKKNLMTSPPPPPIGLRLCAWSAVPEKPWAMQPCSRVEAAMAVNFGTSYFFQRPTFVHPRNISLRTENWWVSQLTSNRFGGRSNTVPKLKH